MHASQSLCLHTGSLGGAWSSRPPQPHQRVQPRVHRHRGCALKVVSSAESMTQALKSTLAAFKEKDMERATSGLSAASGLNVMLEACLRRPDIRILNGCFRSEVLSTLALGEEAGAGPYCCRVRVTGVEPMGIERCNGTAEGTFVFHLSLHENPKGGTGEGRWLVDSIKREYEPDPRLAWLNFGRPSV